MKSTSRVSPRRKSQPRPVVRSNSTPSWPSGWTATKLSSRASVPQPLHQRCRQALERNPCNDTTTGSARSAGPAGASSR